MRRQAGLARYPFNGKVLYPLFCVNLPRRIVMLLSVRGRLLPNRRSLFLCLVILSAGAPISFYGTELGE